MIKWSAVCSAVAVCLACVQPAQAQVTLDPVRSSLVTGYAYIDANAPAGLAMDFNGFEQSAYTTLLESTRTLVTAVMFFQMWNESPDRPGNGILRDDAADARLALTLPYRHWATLYWPEISAPPGPSLFFAMLNAPPLRSPEAIAAHVAQVPAPTRITYCCSNTVDRTFRSFADAGRLRASR